MKWPQNWFKWYLTAGYNSDGLQYSFLIFLDSLDKAPKEYV